MIGEEWFESQWKVTEHVLPIRLLAAQYDDFQLINHLPDWQFAGDEKDAGGALSCSDSFRDLIRHRVMIVRDQQPPFPISPGKQLRIAHGTEPHLICRNSIKTLNAGT